MGKSENKAIRAMVVVVSAAVHLYALHAFSIPEPSPKPEDPNIIELVNLSEKPEPEKKKPEEKLKGQVVDLGPEDPNDKTPPPENSRLLSERNMRTKRETIKRSRSKTGSPGARSIKNKKPKAAAKKSKKKRSAKKNEKIKTAKKGKGQPAGSARTKPEDLTREDLKLTMADMRQALTGDNGSIDYVPNAAKGRFTSLNARKFAYAAFYNQIKKVIRFYWEPNRAASTIRWSGQSLETRLRVVVQANGTLASVETVKSSGYPVLDAAAIRAVRKAAPFYNVPKGLLNEDNQLNDIWAFYLVAE